LTFSGAVDRLRNWLFGNSQLKAMNEQVNQSELLAALTRELCEAGEAFARGGEGEDKDGDSERQKGYLRAASGVLKLKALNRQLSTSSDRKRRLIEQHKERVDKLHLQLENLLYKKAYLLREIRECRDFTTPALQAVENEVNEKIAANEFTSNLPKLHENAISFLENEMQLREEGRCRLEERKQKYQASEEVLDGRRKIVDELPGRIGRVEVFVKEELDPIFQRSHNSSISAMEIVGQQ